MFNRFDAPSLISAEEFEVLKTYLENPHHYSDIIASPYFDPDFLFGIRISAPIDNIRYFILPCDEDNEYEELFTFPIKSRLTTDFFDHEAIFLDDEVYLFLPTLDSKEKLKLLVNQDNHFLVVKAAVHEMDFTALNPELFPFPMIQYGDYFYQIMNHVGKDLELFIHENPHLTSTQKDKIARGLYAEVQKLHNHDFIHTDIKACNFCIRESDLSVCLVDYDEIIHISKVKFNVHSMGTFTALGPEFFQSHIVQFAQDAKSLRQVEICIYQALTQINAIFYPYFLQPRSKQYSFRSNSFFESKADNQLFSSLSSIVAKPIGRFTRYELERDILKYGWKQQFTKESDLYALACLLKFELQLEAESEFYPLIQQMLHPEPIKRNITAHF